MTEIRSKMEPERGATILDTLQQLSCQQQLHGVLEKHLGAAGDGEDYGPVAVMLVTRYREARACFRGLKEPAAAAPDAAEAAAEVKVRKVLFENAVNGLVQPATYSAAFAAAAASEAKAASNDDDDDVDGDALLPAGAMSDAFALVHANQSVDMGFAVRHGAQMITLEAERKEQMAAAARRDDPLASKHMAVRMTPEDKFLMAQLSRVDGAELMDDRVDDYDDQVIEVELSEREPKFLRGLGVRLMNSMAANAENLRNAKYAAQNAVQGRGGGQGGAGAQGRGAGPAGKAFASQVGAEEKDSGDPNTMVAAAKRQKEYARERRELRSQLRRKQRELEEHNGDDEMTTRMASGFGRTELDEGREEQGMRSQADLPQKLPPWMRAVHGSDKSAVKWGKTTNLGLQEQRRRLPIFSWRDKILETVDANKVTVLVGETGSGKTTQLAQYLCEHGLAQGGMIACTQPRRVAAISLAERVAEEYGCAVGEDVGFTVRFQDVTSPVTKIKYLTDGMLLREALFDDTFGKYRVIILDEAHERSLNTDVLFALVKAAVHRRDTLKVIVTSATLDVEKFCEYFGHAAPLTIPGRTHPVDIRYLDAPVEDYLDHALRVVMGIHLQEPPGDVLVFFTGQDEIEAAAEKLHQWTTSEDLEGIPKMLITVIFGALPSENQSTVFDKTPPGQRKVVLATNIAETSITIDELYYVVDCGFCKQNVFNAKTGVESLQVVPVSQQQATQRSGRAGRTGPGRCYRLYTQAQFTSQLPATTIPEIHRTNLCNVVLTLKATGVGNMMTFDFMDPPPKEMLVNALEKLHYLGALDEEGVLTKLGSRMSELPLDPSQCKTLLTALDLGCAPTVLTVVSMLSTQNVFFRPRDRQEEADRRKARFHATEGDQITLLNIYDHWADADYSTDWCKDNFIQQRALKDASDIRRQLEAILSRKKAITSDVFANRDLGLVRKAITAGYFFQAAKRTAAGSYKTLSDHREVSIHPSSALHDVRPRYLVYHELILTSKEFMRQAMTIDPRWLVELAPSYFSTPEEGRLTKEQMSERIDPTLRRWEQGNDWRISKVRRGRGK
jgi:ATP-dependent RNA helicase DHX8/PRP22